ncbi:MAG: phage holin family protein [Bacteroidota bacterium]
MEKKEKGKLFKFLRLDAIIDNLTGLIETRIELAKIEMKEEVAKIGARIIAGVVLAFLLVMIIIFLSISAATWINSLMESTYMGYVIVTGFYLVVFILIIILKAHVWLQQKIESGLIDTEETSEEDE